MRRSRVNAVAFTAVLGTLIALVVDLRVQPGGRHVTREVDDLVQLAAAGIASVAAGVRARRSGRRIKASWALISLGAGGWCAGQCVWTYYEVLAGRVTPFPSLADVGYLLFPVFALGGILLRPSRAFVGQGRLRIAIDGLLVAASLFALSWATSLGAVYQAGGDSRLATAVSVAYPGSDLVLLTAIVIVVSYARAGSRSGLVWLASGLVCLAVADSGFSYLTASGRYTTGNLVDVGWVGGFLVLALTALLDSAPADTDLSRIEAPPRGALLLPYLPATVALISSMWQLHARNGGDRAILVASAIVVAMLMSRQVIVLLDNRVLMARVTHQAFHDALTGLANRALFKDRLVHALDLHRRDLRPLALLLIDLDEFKEVNDTLGHPAGDELLTRVSERLLASTRRGDTVARLGGDEFVVLTEDDADALGLAGRLLAALDIPISIGRHHITIGASIGIATVKAEDATPTSTDMLMHADLALYAAKRAGKAIAVVYHSGLDPQTDGSDHQAEPVAATLQTG